MRIYVVSGYGYWGDWTPTDLVKGRRQVGGGETAMVQISRELAALGNEVYVFYDVERPGRYDGVDYVSTAMFVPMITQIQHDVLISWDNPFALRFADAALARVLVFQLNDAFIGPYDWTIDLYFHPSQWHADRFHELYPEMTREKSLVRLTNGIDYQRFASVLSNGSGVERDPYRVIYSSSPDRGLHHLLDMWPDVVKAEPQANLHVFYDMSKWLEADSVAVAEGVTTITSERAEMMRRFLKSPPPNVTFHGGVGQAQLAEEQLKSAVLAYPCDPVNPTEGFSMTVLEGIVAGCDVLISDADAFPELWSNAPGVTMLPLPIERNVWVETLAGMLNKKDARDIRAREDLSWKALGRRWDRELKACLSKRLRQ